MPCFRSSDEIEDINILSHAALLCANKFTVSMSPQVSEVW